MNREGEMTRNRLELLIVRLGILALMCGIHICRITGPYHLADKIKENGLLIGIILLIGIVAYIAYKVQNYLKKERTDKLYSKTPENEIRGNLIDLHKQENSEIINGNKLDLHKKEKQN